MKDFYDRRKGESIQYKPGDQVLLEGKNIASDRPKKKLDDKSYGPFEVEKKVGNSAYKLKLPATWRGVHPVFNEVLLTPFKPPALPSQKAPPPPPPVTQDGQVEYEVEEILDSKCNRNGKNLKYLVHWKGYPRSARTWEPPANLTHCADLLAEFHAKNPDKPRPQETRKLEIPMNKFPKHLFRPLPETVTELTLPSLPTEQLLHRLSMRSRP